MKSGVIEQVIRQLSELEDEGEQVLAEVDCSPADKVRLQALLQRCGPGLAKRLRDSVAHTQRRHDDVVNQLSTLENRLLQSEKMAAIGQLSAGVAHEINNPIGYLGSNLNALRDYMNSLLDLISGQQTLLEQSELAASQLGVLTALIEQSGLDYIRQDLPLLMQESQEGIERVRRTVQDLKDFSRTDGEVFAWANLHTELEKVINIAHYQLKQNVTLVRHFGELPEVFCSPGQLNQVFLNMLLNACQAMQKPGEVHLTTRCERDWVCVEIIDQGAGMASDTLDHLFEPFFTTKPAGEGTGLGLSISRKIIEHHHGEIEVESVQGEGSTFRVWLPVEWQQDGAVSEGTT